MSILNTLYHFHWVEPGEQARSAQPYAGFWRAFFAGNALKGVINLRGAHPEWKWWAHEVAVCKALDIEHIDIRLNSRRFPAPELLGEIFAAFDAMPRPFLVKCSGGQDRTSLVSALYIVHRFGWAAADRARRQFAAFPYLHVPKRDQKWLRHFLDFARERAQGRPVAEWAAHGYDPRDLASWLRQSGIIVPRSAEPLLH